MFFRKKIKIKRPLIRRIINYFIGTCVALIVVSLIAFGYTQTSSFRNWLKDFLVEQVNSSTNGKLSIEHLDGTIFTSLILSNTSYEFEKDTLLSAEKIELKVSPLRILLKTIFVRKLEINNADISLLKDENGVLNLSKITNPHEEKVMEETVTKTEPFSWKVNISELHLKNINFRHQSYANKNSTAYYSQPEMEDLRLENLNLSLSAEINIAESEYQLYISEFSANPNLSGFKLLNLTGNFILLKDMAGVTDLKIITERSFISINAAASEFYFFDEEGINLENSPVKIELSAMNLNFDDVTNFIDGTDILKGSVETHVSAEGTLTDLELKNLELNFNETSLNAFGHLQNILDGGEMLIEVKFRDSFVNQDDITNLLPTIGIPTYKDYGILQFDSLSFSGKPLKFSANMLLQTDRGNISGLVKMDLTGEEIVYDYKVKTKNLNLMPVAGLNTNLNMIASLNGKGFSPKNLETSVQINTDASTIEGVSFRDFSISAEGSKGIINSNILFTSLETRGRLTTKFDFTDTANTKYDFDIVLAGFNIYDFIKESEVSSDLNITLKGEGENFSEENLNLFAVLEIDSSRLNDIQIDSTTLIADIRSSEENRIINIISDLADLTITGKFTLPELIDAIAGESALLSSAIQKKIDQIQPPDFTKPKSLIKSENLTVKPAELSLKRNLNVQYLLELKSFELLSLFLGNAEIEVDGEILGKLIASGDTTILTLDTKINQMKYWDGLELFYLSEFDLYTKINNKSLVDSFEGFKADVEMNVKRIFVGSDISDLKFSLNFNQNNAQISMSAVYDEFTSLDFSGSMEVENGLVNVFLDRLFFKYYNFDLLNSGNIKFSYSNEKFIFDSFKLNHNGGILNLNGELSLTGKEDLVLKLNNFKVKNLTENLIGLPAERSFNGELNLEFLLTGTANDPQIILSYAIDSIKIQNYYLGSVKSVVNYNNKMLNVDFSFFETVTAKPRRSLGIEGTVPIDLSFNAKERFSNNDLIDITFFADKFDLRFAAGFVPGIKNIKGLMNGEINFKGEYNDIKNTGSLSIVNSSFVFETVNLTYLIDAQLKFEKNKIIISNLNLSNEKNLKDGGSIIVTGEYIHKNFVSESIKIQADGSLKLFDNRSRAANPALYGNIAVKTRKPIVFNSSESRSSLNADLILKDGASITYSPTQSAFSNENDKFTYIFISALSEDLQKKEIDSLIQVSEKRKTELEPKVDIPFNLNLKLEVEKEAKVVFVISREFKQNLTAYLGGNIEYSIVNSIPFAKGELTLLDGSKLDFIKTFRAEGNIRFLDEIDNPYVNVIATYESFYSPDTIRTSTNEWDIQIRIKLEGPAENITTKFLQDESSIEVYKSRRNANQFELDATKTASDAMFFIIVNKFPEDASLQESNFAASTAASLAGSIVGTVLNEKLGDVVRSVNVQQVGSETIFSLIGKVGNFRYEIGGTSQVFQDLSRANVKIEHPLYFPNLIIRFDRKEPSYQSSTYSEMINELGLKYSFVF